MLVIHMDPVERDNKRLAQYRSLISRVLMDIDIRLSFHDFRMVGSGKNVCLVFDLVVPREYKASAVGRLKNRINNEVSRRERDAAVPSQQKTVFVQRNMDRRNRHCRHFSPGRRDNGNWYNGNGTGKLDL